MKGVGVDTTKGCTHISVDDKGKWHQKPTA